MYLYYTLLFGSNILNDVKNLCILNTTIEYFISTKGLTVLFK